MPSFFRSKKFIVHSPAGFFSDTDKGIIITKVIYLPETGKKLPKFSFEIPWYNKMLIPTKSSRDQEISVTIFTLASV